MSTSGWSFQCFYLQAANKHKSAIINISIKYIIYVLTPSIVSYIHTSRLIQF